MPIKLSHLKEKVRNLTVDLGEGDKLTLSYKPNAMTLADEQEIAAAKGTSESSSMTLKLLRNMLVLWDVVDEDDTPLPINDASLNTFPSATLVSILDAIQEDQSPNVKKGRR